VYEGTSLPRRVHVQGINGVVGTGTPDYSLYRCFLLPQRLDGPRCGPLHLHAPQYQLCLLRRLISSTVRFIRSNKLLVSSSSSSLCGVRGVFTGETERPSDTYGLADDSNAFVGTWWVVRDARYGALVGDALFYANPVSDTLLSPSLVGDALLSPNFLGETVRSPTVRTADILAQHVPSSDLPRYPQHLWVQAQTHLEAQEQVHQKVVARATLRKRNCIPHPGRL